MSRRKWLLPLLLACPCIIQHITAQAYKQEQVASGQQAKGSYIFKAQTVLPQGGGGPRQLTAGFVLKVTADSVICYLPYYGRAYQAPYGSNDNAVDFTSVRFDYKEGRTRKGLKTITIIPEDNNDVRQLFLTLSGDGYATVNITFSQRQPISYNGEMDTVSP